MTVKCLDQEHKTTLAPELSTQIMRPQRLPPVMHQSCMPLTTVLNVNNYSAIELNHMVGSQNADFGLRTTELNYSVDIDQE